MIAHSSAAQINWVRKKYDKVGFLEMKTIEVDSITYLAKETVPFDRPFYLKIKRADNPITKPKPKGPLSKIQTVVNSTTDVKIEPNDSIPPTVTETKSSTITETKENLIPSPPEVLPLQITEIALKQRITSVHNSLGTAVFDPMNSRDAIIYQDDKDSDYVLILVKNLKPNSGYELEIRWAESSTAEAYKHTYLFSTIAPTLVKGLEQVMSPQIGVASAFFKEGGKLHSDVSLMVGVHIQLLPVDNNIPIWFYEYYAPQRFSTFLGLTINSMAKDNRRDDLFGDNNILLGVGYQLTNSLRFSYGGMAFQEINPNRILADRKSVAYTTYGAVTLDLKLKDLIGGIFTVLGFE